MTGLHPLDWAAIGLYMLGMLGIGQYYARRTRSNEDYLLGNRNLGWRSVGLSLFASLLSTVTYLAMPGEMIRHGPLAFAKILTYPFVFAFVGFWLIPCFMRLRVTSAYEILERRFGISVRLLGSAIFLISRMLWMGVIVYMTVSVILIPVMQLPESWTPAACLVMGLVTVVYTSAGGLRAVVMADAVQSIILLGGAVLTIGAISYSMGGVEPWLPSGWQPHWDELNLGLQSSSRVSLISSMMAGFSLALCLSGSDQMAIQRYLATRDASTARRVLAMSLGTSFVSMVLLATVGIALLGYIAARPEFLPPDLNVMTEADGWFPYFIMAGLPPGVTGVVIAGLLAAAMSSLSSGVNSSCLVISVDFLQRFGYSSTTDAGRVRQTKAISWLVGGVVVLSSLAVQGVEGNFFELTNKVANLLAAPLFVLFFLAVFIRWATTAGAWLAAIAAITVAILISFYQEVFHEEPAVSFLWAVPLSLIAGVTVGCLASLLPGSQRRPPLEQTDV